MSGHTWYAVAVGHFAMCVVRFFSCVSEILTCCAPKASTFSNEMLVVSE